MEGFKEKIICSAVGATSGLTGLSFISTCQGSVCASCLGCAWAGAGIALIVLLKKIKVKKEVKNGMA